MRAKLAQVWPAGSAEEVLCHAARQRRRGRRPSMWYGGCKNPTRALRMAERDVLRRPKGGLALDEHTITRVCGLIGEPATYTMAYGGLTPGARLVLEVGDATVWLMLDIVVDGFNGPHGRPTQQAPSSRLFEAHIANSTWARKLVGRSVFGVLYPNGTGALVTEPPHPSFRNEALLRSWALND